jgi:hypothetical protein
MSCPIISCSHLPIFHFCIAIHCALPAPHSMAEETVSNPPPVILSVDDADVENDSGSESATMTASSSPTYGFALMADGKIPEMSDFFKKTTIMDDKRQGYHDLGWLTGNLLSSILEVDVPTVDGSIVLYFESDLVAGLGLPPSKFLISIMNFLGYSLVHFNPNALAALSSFNILCECWLGIQPNSSLFWYYYTPVRYAKMIYGGIGLSLRCHR